MRNLLSTNHGRKAKTINDAEKSAPTGGHIIRLTPCRPLQPKPECPLTAVRLQIKAGGYDLIPLHGKKGFEGWRTQPNDAASVRKWWGDSTGIRMYGNDVFVIDIDVNIAEVVRDILGAYAKRWPAFMRGCLRRHSGANKIALIGRGNITRRQGRTARYFAEPDDTGGKGHMVEFFGRNAKRLMAVHGQHSEGRVYGYHGDAIWDRPLDSLPWFHNEGVIPPTRYGNNKEWVIEEESEVLGIAAEIMVKHGLEWRETSADRGAGCVNASSTRRLYDLEPEMVIDLADDSTETLADLEAMVKAGTTWLGNPRNPTRLAAYANLWDSGSTTRDRVLIAIGSTGLCLWDTKFDISHRWKHRAPPPDEFGDKLKALLAKHQAARGQS